jgi:short-subunit dehydrogenase
MTGVPSRPVALVTGASAGIGLDIARVLARRGHDLALAARRRDVLERVAAELASAHGVRVAVCEIDLAEDGAPARLVDELASRGLAVDVLVNNAGFGAYGEFKDTDLAAEQRMIAVNVTALVALTKLCLPAMLAANRGRILNVSSVAGFLPGPRMSVYYATKAFVTSFSEALAEELRHTGVRVTALCPGGTATEFQAVAGVPASRLKRAAMMTSIEVAEAGVDAMLAGRRIVVTGLVNRAVPWVVRLLPRRVVTALSRRASEVG